MLRLGGFGLGGSPPNRNFEFQDSLFQKSPSLYAFLFRYECTEVQTLGGRGKYGYASFIGVRRSTSILHPCMHNGIKYRFIMVRYQTTGTGYHPGTIDFMSVYGCL